MFLLSSGGIPHIVLCRTRSLTSVNLVGPFQLKILFFYFVAEKPPGKAPWDSIRHNSVLDPANPNEASTPDSDRDVQREGKMAEVVWLLWYKKQQ